LHFDVFQRGFLALALVFLDLHRSWAILLFTLIVVVDWLLLRSFLLCFLALLGALETGGLDVRNEIIQVHFLNLFFGLRHGPYRRLLWRLCSLLGAFTPALGIYASVWGWNNAFRDLSGRRRVHIAVGTEPQRGCCGTSGIWTSANIETALTSRAMRFSGLLASAHELLVHKVFTMLVLLLLLLCLRRILRRSSCTLWSCFL